MLTHWEEARAKSIIARPVAFVTQPVPGFSGASAVQSLVINSLSLPRCSHDYFCAIFIDVLKLAVELEGWCRAKNVSVVSLEDEISTHCNDSVAVGPVPARSCPQTGHALEYRTAATFGSFWLDNKFAGYSRLRRQLLAGPAEASRPELRR